MPSKIGRIGAVLLAVVLTAACPGAEQPAREDSGDSAARAAESAQATASCLPLVPDIRGSLVGQRERAQGEARRLRVSGDGMPQRDSASDAMVTIAPACGSHAFDEEHLAHGQFVARLTIDGTAPRFSPFPNDTVYWWVYLDLTSGTPVFHSEFLSAAAASDTGRVYVRRGTFVIRCKAMAERPKTEIAGWEAPHGPEACPVSDAQMRVLMQPTALDSGTQGGGTSPWFGCKLGCCQSTVLES